jgi:hypothetical protein
MATKKTTPKKKPVKTTPKRKPVKTIPKKTTNKKTGYQSFTKSYASITDKQVLKVCDMVTNGSFIDTAITLNNIDKKAWWELTNRNVNKGRQEWVNDQIAIAEAQKEDRLLQMIVSNDDSTKNSFKSKIIQQFLETTNPKFSRKLQVQYKYDVHIFFDVLETHIEDDEILLAIYEDLANMDPYNVVAEMDLKLSK